MNLVKRPCLIRLTAAGRQAIGDTVLTTDKGSFEALVEDEDQRGIWVRLQGEEKLPEHVLLIKWEYVATVEIMKAPISD